MTLRDHSNEAIPDGLNVPATLLAPGGAPFWSLAVVTGIVTGIGAAALTLLLKAVQHLAWPGPAGATLLDAASAAAPWRPVVLLTGAGLVTGLGQILLVRLSSGNGIDIMEAIWFRAGRLPAIRTLGSAVLSIVIVGMGASLGREGAPKQAGAVAADLLSSLGRLTDEQRRLLVACGAGAGMAAAYGVPLGGALFAVEVLRGALALRLVLPALMTSLVATVVSWTVLPDAVTYDIPAYPSTPSAMAFALVAGPIIGILSVGIVRAVAWADRNRPRGLRRVVAPVVALGLVGAIAIPLPGVPGNGKDVAELAFTGRLAPVVATALLMAKPLAVILCLGAGAPGGLFTPTLATGALAGSVLGALWLQLWPGAPAGLCALVGAAALLAATTQGPISAIVLMMELTGHDRAFVAPLILAVVGATLVARTIERRSIYEARLSDAEVAERLREREIGTGRRDA